MTPSPLVKRGKCPVCGCARPKHGCFAFEDGNVACCDKAQDHQARGGVKFWSGFKDAWRYAPDPLGLPAPSSPGLPASPAARHASPDLIHRVYSKALELCSAPDQRNYLRDKRGASIADQKRLGCSAVPKKRNAAAWIQLERWLNLQGVDFSGVPGVWHDGKGWRWEGCFNPSAYFEPRRDIDGNLVALQWRGKGHKERGVTSSVKEQGGSSPGSPIGWHRPSAVLQEEWVGIAEGFWKAEAVSKRYGVTALALPGHHSKDLPGVLAQLRARHPEVTTLRLAPDQDCHENKQVRAGWDLTVKQCLNAGFRVLTYDWRDAYAASKAANPSKPSEWLKGIDDLLKAGQQPEEPTEAVPAKPALNTAPEGAKRSRSGLQVRRGPALLVAPAPSLEHVRAEVERFARRACDAARNPLGVPTLYFCKTPPSTGKSFTVRSVLERSGLTALYLVSDLGLVPSGAPRYGGMTKTCSSLKDIGPLLKRGVSHSAACKDPLCPYLLQNRGPVLGQTKWAAYQSAQVLKGFLEGYDIVVADDIPAYSFGLTSAEATLKDLADWQEFSASDAGREYQACSDFGRVLLEAHGQELVGTAPVAGVKILAALRARLGSRPLEKAIQEALACFKRNGEPVRDNARPGAPCYGLRNLTYAARVEIEAERGCEWNRRLFATPSGWRWHRPIEFPDTPFSVMVTDADADVEAWQKIFPHHRTELLDIPRVAISDGVEIVQYLGERFGKVSLSKGPSMARAARLLEEVKEAMRAEGIEPSVISSMGFLEAMGLLGDPSTAHFGNLRSKNHLAASDGLIAVGTHATSEYSQHEGCQAFWGAKSPLVTNEKTTEERRRTGRLEDIIDNVPCWADERLRRLAHYQGAAEARQAIERARLPAVGTGGRQTVKVFYAGHHSLPYLVNRFEGPAIERMEKKEKMQTELKAICEALASGAVPYGAGRPALVEATGISDWKVRDALKDNAKEVAEARAAGRHRAEQAERAKRVVAEACEVVKGAMLARLRFEVAERERVLVAKPNPPARSTSRGIAPSRAPRRVTV